MTSTAQTVDQFTQDWEEWHRKLDTDRAAPHGFLAYTGFNLLTEEPQRFDGLPGAWSTGPDGVAVDLGESESLEVGGHPVTGHHVFAALAEREFRVAGAFGDARAELSRRGGRDIVRALHPTNPTRLAFRGTPAYAPDPAWVLTGTFEPWETVRDLEIRAYLPTITHRHDSPGRVRFTYQGVEHVLTLISAGRATSDAAPTAIVLFRDRTSGVTTYEASRSLAVTLSSGPEVVLDFNRAKNLQCAYIEFAPCPLAPAENHLPFAVEAGEKTPYEKRAVADLGGGAAR